MTTPPPCPVTGEPARRLVQWVSARLLVELWRIVFRVDVRPSFGGVTRFGLWESPTGLYFFDPPREGDRDFYRTFYERLRSAEPGERDREILARLNPGHRAGEPTLRPEFDLAAAQVRPGDRVLDVGCGPGDFRRLLPAGARYAGLDPHFGADPKADWASAESLSDHLVGHAGTYDVVTAFQVVEHVSDPVGLVADMARAARPGGRVVIGVPGVPSAATRIPNYLTNAVPHHLTWWTPAALKALAGRVGLVEASVQQAPWGEMDAVIYWIARCSPIKCTTRHYRHAWTWHAAGLIGVLGAIAMRALRRPPGHPGDEGGGLVLVASVPDGPPPA